MSPLGITPWKMLKLAEAGLAMLLTVGVVGAIILVVLCAAFSVPWLAGIVGLVIAWALLTWDFYSAELESSERTRGTREDEPRGPDR